MTTMLSDLHSRLFEENNSTLPDIAPLKAVNEKGPVIVMDRWRKNNNVLIKRYSFRTMTMRNVFIRFMLAYEEKVQHNAKIIVDANNVTFHVTTRNIEQVTEIDKEYARFADATYKDVVYNNEHD